jgi:hypothetical protein
MLYRVANGRETASGLVKKDLIGRGKENIGNLLVCPLIVCQVTQ